jgi:hypothetical protein
VKKNITRILAAALPVLILAGCVQVSVLDRTATPEEQSLAATLNTREEHDLAILAVEFDPPLDALQAVPDTGEIALRVAVENKGYRKEVGIKVTIRLLVNPTGVLIQEETQDVESLAPGEIRIVQFKGVLPSPHRSQYRLEIGASPVSGETRWTNNYKDYEIRIAGR